MVDEAQETFDAGVAAGVFVRSTTDGTLGNMTPDEAYEMATDIAADPAALGQVSGVELEHVPVLNPLASREVLMRMYDSQRAVDAINSAHETAMRLRDSTIANRYSSMMRHAKVTPEQMERVEFDRLAGDLTPLNKIREKYFFE